MSTCTIWFEGILEKLRKRVGNGHESGATRIAILCNGQRWLHGRTSRGKDMGDRPPHELLHFERSKECT